MTSIAGSTSPLEQYAKFLPDLIADQPDLTLDEIVDAHPRFRPSVNYLTFGPQKICEPYAAKLKATGRDSMRTAWIGLAVVVAIGLIWSVAATSKWVPVNSAEMMSVAISPHATTVGQGERPQAPANRTKDVDGASGRDLVRLSGSPLPGHEDRHVPAQCRLDPVLHRSIFL